MAQTPPFFARPIKNAVYDPGTLSWVPMEQPGGGGGGGDASAANQVAGNASLTSIDSKLTSPLTVTGPLTDTQLRATPVPVSGPLTDVQIRATPLPVSGTVTATGPLTDAQLRATPVPVSGTVTSTPSGTQSTKEVRASSPAQSTVNDSASSVALLSSNANRLGATIANDSSAALYVKLGATASLTSYTAKVLPGGYYEVPYGFTGAIDGIWATDPGDGAARITELT